MYPGTPGTILLLSIGLYTRFGTFNSTYASLFHFLRHFPRLLIRVRAFQSRLKISSLVHLPLQHVHRQKVSRLFAVSDAFLNLLFIGRVFVRIEMRPDFDQRRVQRFLVAGKESRARGGVPGRAF